MMPTGCFFSDFMFIFLVVVDRYLDFYIILLLYLIMIISMASLLNVIAEEFDIVEFFSCRMSLG